MATCHFAKALTGGGSNALDGINHTRLGSQDWALVANETDSTIYIYVWDQTNSDAESEPDCINPDSNTGSGRWLLFQCYGVGGGSGGGGTFNGYLYDANSVKVAEIVDGCIDSLITAPFLLLESGDKILQENGRYIFLQDA